MNVLQWNVDAATEDAVKRFNKISGTQYPTVQFIHESVRDFLFKEDDVGSIWQYLGYDLEGRSYGRLERRCLNSMSMDIESRTEPHETLSQASTQKLIGLRVSAAHNSPFLEYAVGNILYHADAAARIRAVQKEFIANLPLKCWIKQNDWFEKHSISRLTNSTGIERDMWRFVRYGASGESWFGVEDESWLIGWLTDLNSTSYLSPRLLKTRNTRSIPDKTGVVSRGRIYTNKEDGLGRVLWADTVWARQVKQKAEASVAKVDMPDKSSIFWRRGTLWSALFSNHCNWKQKGCLRICQHYSSRSKPRSTYSGSASTALTTQKRERPSHTGLQIPKTWRHGSFSKLLGNRAVLACHCSAKNQL